MFNLLFWSKNAFHAEKLNRFSLQFKITKFRLLILVKKIHILVKKRFPVFSTWTPCFPPDPLFSTTRDPVPRSPGLQLRVFHIPQTNHFSGDVLVSMEWWSSSIYKIKFTCNGEGMQLLFRNYGRFPFNQKFRNFRNGDKWYRNFLGRVPENPEIVKFPKSEPFNRKIRKLQNENQMEQKFPRLFFSNI